MKKIIKNISIYMFIFIMLFSTFNIYATQIDVNNTQENIVVEDIDLGDYTDTMSIGEKQLLTVTVLPINETQAKVVYNSSDTNVATINGLGRITALSKGKTIISVTAEDIKKTFELTVTEKEDSVIEVTDIQISGYEEEIEVGKTMALSSTVIPSNANETSITYNSLNPNIATVSQSGEIKGISKGNATITLTAGNFVKSIEIKVIVPTKGIFLNETYLVLKSGDKFQLKSNVLPLEANQDVTYKSVDENIATISNNGLIQAKNIGTTTIIVSNNDYTTSVSVIVNKTIEYKNDFDNNSNIIDENKKIDNVIYASEQNIVGKEILKEIYNKKQTLKIVGNGYEMIIDGKNIVNYNNEIYTDILLNRNKKGVEFEINTNGGLCGDIILHLENPSGKYLYLYNNSKQIYEEVKIRDLTEMKITTQGKYILSHKKIGMKFSTIMVSIIIGVITIILCVLIYVLVKKRYWFW